MKSNVYHSRDPTFFSPLYGGNWRKQVAQGGLFKGISEIDIWKNSSISCTPTLARSYKPHWRSDSRTSRSFCVWFYCTILGGSQRGPTATMQAAI